MFSLFTNRGPAFTLAFLCLLAVPLRAQCLKKRMGPPSHTVGLAKWEKIDYTKTAVGDAELRLLRAEDLALVRGIIFGRHGRVFKEPNIQSFLDHQSWYKADPHYSNEKLNKEERVNLDKVRLAEAAAHDKIQPGDLRYWAQKSVPAEKIKAARVLDLHIMKAEIEAIHGKTFPSEPSLQAYFDDRYWYKRDLKYNAKSLSRTEHGNFDLLDKAEKAAGNRGPGAENMPAYQNAELPDRALSKTPLYDLRLMRNAFYALHGRKFKTPWIAEYFESQDWYKPLDRPTPLSPVEEANVAKIVKREDEIHNDLGTVPLTHGLVSHLALEDVKKLRNEIYARHGRIFKTKWLQSYFASLPWYKPNPSYSNALLNRVERRNLGFLAEFEAGLQVPMDMAEG